MVITTTTKADSKAGTTCHLTKGTLLTWEGEDHLKAVTTLTDLLKATETTACREEAEAKGDLVALLRWATSGADMATRDLDKDLALDTTNRREERAEEEAPRTPAGVDREAECSLTTAEELDPAEEE